ncbi:hypothetical protein RIF29_31222 [Crotalaria pallida]|uniref:C-JID domain-containing protein n=1 Tax=Crotalaria pallida TaxID=3830 RepID=A0AAN9HXF8_CROPI
MNSVNFFYPTKHKDSAALLLPSLRCFLCLRDLDLSFCNLSQVPDAIGWLHGLENLKLGGNNFDRLPSIKQLSKLTSLDLSHCKQLKSCHELPTTTILPTVMRSPTELCIFNCPKLQEMECWNNVAFPWMLQVIQAQQESSTLIRFINIFIPGNQIPSWYNIQSVGDSINVDPSSVSYDSNWIGVSFCVPFPPCNLPYIAISNREPDVIFNFTCICSGKVYLHRTCLEFKCGITAKDPVEKYHLWLFYMTREEFISVISSQGEETHNLYHINFEIIAYDSIFRDERKFKVKKCGMRWVYKQDLEPHVHDGDFRIGSPILSLEPANSSA